MRNNLDFNKIYPQKNGGLIKVLSKNLEKVSTNGLYRWYNVKFLDCDEILVVSKQSIEKGLIKHPLSLKDQDFIKNLSFEDKKLYEFWNNLKYKDKKQEIILDKSWHHFYTFYKWYKNNCYDSEEELRIDISINKNISFLKENIYSPYTCIIIPKEIFKFINSDNPYSGVTRLSSGLYNAHNDIESKTFNSFKEAKKYYANYKYSKLLEYIDNYKNLPSTIIDTLLKYDFSWENYFDISLEKIYKRYKKYTLSSISNIKKAKEFDNLIKDLSILVKDL